jgi:hypothetical protein
MVAERDLRPGMSGARTAQQYGQIGSREFRKTPRDPWCRKPREHTCQPPATPPPRVLRWGTQLGVRPIGAFGHGEDLTEQALASYVATQATKAAEATGTVDRRIGKLAELAELPVLTDHTGRLIHACSELDAACPEPKLWHWAHLLGLRGHFSTMSRRNSTTLGDLRQVRAEYRATQQGEALGLPDPDDAPEATTLTLAHWTCAGHGHTTREILARRPAPPRDPAPPRHRPRTPRRTR